MNLYASTIAKLINGFNAATIFIVACFAVVGVLVAVIKIFRIDIFELRRQSVIAKAFCVAALAAFALEATAFNFPHYLKYVAGPPIDLLEISEESIADGIQVEATESGVHVKNINSKVTSVYVDIDFKNIETVEGLIKWTDEATQSQYSKKFYKYLPHENYALLQSCGKVSELEITFTAELNAASAEADVDMNVLNIVMNKPVPFYFSGLRLLIFSVLFFALFALAHKTLRAKTAYYLFEYAFDPKNKKQNIVYACTVALLILFSWVCAYTSAIQFRETSSRRLYDKFLVDALIDGRTYLADNGDTEKLRGMERPYNPKLRRENGLVAGIHWMNDWTWYKGKYYCYFGVVPAVVLYVPYKMVTGKYLSDHAGTFLFCAAAVILLSLLWRYCVKKYMPDTGYALYLLSFPTLFFSCSGLCAVLRYTSFYSIVQSAGFMFTVAGVLLLLKSVDREKINRLTLFFACLCLALVFGCRPNMGLASLLVPVVLWKYRSWKLLLFVALPYILVAIPLCAYNYVRFESIFEFGIKYQLTWIDHARYDTLNPIGKIVRTFVCVICYLFYPNALSLHFPFVVATREYKNIVLGCLVSVGNDGGAMINFPIVFCLFYMFKKIFDKNKPVTFRLLYSFLIIAVVITVLESLVGGYIGRYALDMSVFIILPSLFCAYYWTKDETSALPPRFRVKTVYALCAVSILIGMFLFVNPTESIRFDPTLYRYLEYSLGILRDV